MILVTQVRAKQSSQRQPDEAIVVENAVMDLQPLARL
jgi:hypothetical protein